MRAIKSTGIEITAYKSQFTIFLLLLLIYFFSPSLEGWSFEILVLLAGLMSNKKESTSLIAMWLAFFHIIIVLLCLTFYLFIKLTPLDGLDYNFQCAYRNNRLHDHIWPQCCSYGGLIY